MDTTNKVLCRLGLILLVASFNSITLSALASSEQTTSIQNMSRIGHLVFMEGDVSIDGTEAELGQELRGKATIVTGAASDCEIVFNDKNVFRIMQNARATIDFSSSVLEIALEKGGVASVLRKLDKVAGNDTFRIRSGNAVAGVRGTSFCVWADEYTTYVCACNGSVHTEDAKGSNEFTLTATHHTAKIYTRQGASFRTESAGMLHHNDEGLESLAARIEEKIDWTKLDT
ncbi:hypothetical protein MASR2M78_18600 [Treponema sp.]